MLGRVRAGGLLADGRAGGRAALRRARLDLPARSRGRGSPGPQRSARCTSTTGCATRPTTTSGTARELCAAARGRARGPPAAAAGAGEPAGVGARRALRRGGADRARARAATWRPGTPPPTRSRRSSTGWRRRRRGGRCWGCARATGSWSGRCSVSRASRRPPTAASAGCAGARTRATSLTRTRAPASAAELVPALRERPSRRPRRTCWRWPRSCATRPTCSTALVDEVLQAAGASCRSPALRELPAALARLVVQRLADGRSGAPAPGAARRLEEILALDGRGRSTCPTGCGRSSSGGVLRFERTPPLPRGSSRRRGPPDPTRRRTLRVPP